MWMCWGPGFKLSIEAVLRQKGEQPAELGGLISSAVLAYQSWMSQERGVTHVKKLGPRIYELRMRHRVVLAVLQCAYW